MESEELKKRLMKIDKEVLINTLVTLSELSVFQWSEQTLDDLLEISKTYSSNRRLNRLLKKLDDTKTELNKLNRRKKRAGGRTKKIR